MIARKKSFVRDKRSPTPKNSMVSNVMSANKARNTKPEYILRKELWKLGYKGYRCNYNKLIGRPDIVFNKKKIAIFVNGCFWHRCPICKLPLPKNNTEFWKEKFERNKKRDENKTKELIKLGWTVITVWECQLKNNKKQVTDSIELVFNHIKE